MVTKSEILNTLFLLRRKVEKSKMKFYRKSTASSLITLLQYVINDEQNMQAFKYFVSYWEKWGKGEE